MSKTRNYHPASVAVMERFFTALDASILDGRVKNVYRYCLDNGIDRRNLYAQRKDVNRGYFEIAWALPLVETHGVSPDWLLLGRGAMFSPAD